MLPNIDASLLTLEKETREMDGKVEVPKVPEVGRQKALQNAGLGQV